MKNYKFLSVIMVLALCFGAAQSVDAKKKKTRKRVHKTEKKQQQQDRAVGCVETLSEDKISPEMIEEKSIDKVPHAQKSVEPEPEEDDVFKSAAHMPAFPGGDGALMSFICKNIRYPQGAQDKGIQGKVIVRFVIEKDGSIGDVVVERGVDSLLDAEAIRVCKMLPRFSPGRNKLGDPVRVWYTLPIVFKLQGATEDGPTGDYAKDARQVGDKMLVMLMREINSEDDVNQMEKDIEALQKKYEDFYKQKGDEELEKYNEELKELGKDPEFSKKFEDAMKIFQENCSKLMR